MPVQTTFENEQTKAVLGGLHGNTNHAEKQNAINEEAANVPFGHVMVRGSAPAKEENPLALLPSSATDDVLGVNIRTFFDDVPTGVDPEGAMDLLKAGSIWVMPEDDVLAGGDVFVNFQAGAEGQVRSDNDGGNAFQLLRARFDTAGGPTSGELALLTLEGVANNA